MTSSEKREERGIGGSETQGCHQAFLEKIVGHVRPLDARGLRAEGFPIWRSVNWFLTRAKRNRGTVEVLKANFALRCLAYVRHSAEMNHFGQRAEVVRCREKRVSAAQNAQQDDTCGPHVNRHRLRMQMHVIVELGGVRKGSGTTVPGGAYVRAPQELETLCQKQRSQGLNKLNTSVCCATNLVPERGVEGNLVR